MADAAVQLSEATAATVLEAAVVALVDMVDMAPVLAMAVPVTTPLVSTTAVRAGVVLATGAAVRRVDNALAMHFCRATLAQDRRRSGLETGLAQAAPLTCLRHAVHASAATHRGPPVRASPRARPLRPMGRATSAASRDILRATAPTKMLFLTREAMRLFHGRPLRRCSTRSGSSNRIRLLP